MRNPLFYLYYSTPFQFRQYQIDGIFYDFKEKYLKKPSSPIEDHAQPRGKQDQQDRRGLFLFELLPNESKHRQKRKNKKSAKIKRRCIGKLGKADEIAQKHRHRRCQDQPHDARTDTAQKRLDTAVFQEITNKRRNQQNDDKGRQDHAERR